MSKFLKSADKIIFPIGSDPQLYTSLIIEPKKYESEDHVITCSEIEAEFWSIYKITLPNNHAYWVADLETKQKATEFLGLINGLLNDHERNNEIARISAIMSDEWLRRIHGLNEGYAAAYTEIARWAVEFYQTFQHIPDDGWEDFLYSNDNPIIEATEWDYFVSKWAEIKAFSYAESLGKQLLPAQG